MNRNVSKEAYEAAYKELLKAMAQDLSGEILFDADKYYNMSKIVYSKDGAPEDLIISVKKEVDGKIVTRELSVKSMSKEALRDALAENTRLSQ